MRSGVCRVAVGGGLHKFQVCVVLQYVVPAC